jgi:hypothetical protein
VWRGPGSSRSSRAAPAMGLDEPRPGSPGPSPGPAAGRCLPRSCSLASWTSCSASGCSARVGVPPAPRRPCRTFFFFGRSASRGWLFYGGTLAVCARPLFRRVFASSALTSAGNETVKPESKSEYCTRKSFLTFTPSLHLEQSRQLRLSANATLRVSDTPDDRPRLTDVDAYGRAFRGSGPRAGLHICSRGVGEGLLSGGLFERVGQGAGGRADLRVEAEASGSRPGSMWRRRSGGRARRLATRSRSPVQSPRARVGAGCGARTRGSSRLSSAVGLAARLQPQRFAGDSSLYGGVEARAWLFTADVPPIPLRVGVLGFADVGRVWLEGESSDRWHLSGGGGVMLAMPFCSSSRPRLAARKVAAGTSGMGSFSEGSPAGAIPKILIRFRAVKSPLPPKDVRLPTSRKI